MAAEIKELFEGKWTAYKFENGDKLLEALGAAFLMRKLMGFVNPTMIFEFEGETITITTTVGPKTIKVSFKLDEEYEVSPPPDEKPCTALSKWSNGVIKTVVTPKDPSGKVQHMDREIINGELVQVFSNGTGVTDIWLLGNKGTMVDGPWPGHRTSGLPAKQAMATQAAAAK